MTQMQKIIKYVANAFAIFLSVTIISSIVAGSYMLFNTFGLIKSNDKIDVDKLQTISNEVTELLTLKMDLDYTNLYIKTGENFKVETDNDNIIFTNNNGNIEIKEKRKNWLFNSQQSNLIVYIPEDMFVIDEINIKTGAGKIDIEKLNTKNLYLELGAGKTEIKNLIVTKKIELDGGVGKIELKNSELNNLNASLGVGEFIFTGKLIGKSKIDSGVGSIKIDLVDGKDNYTIKVSKGLGSITIDNKDISDDKTYGNGYNYLDIDGGVGSIKVNFLD